METKRVEKTQAAVHTFKTTLLKIGEAVGVKPNMIMEELGKQNIAPSAPQIWDYEGCTGHPESEFTLNICVPVPSTGADTEQISFKELNEYSCISHIHNGAWSEFAAVYEKLFQDIAKAGKIPTGNTREVYHHCDFEDQSKCITEIQVEIQ